MRFNKMVTKLQLDALTPERLLRSTSTPLSANYPEWYLWSNYTQLAQTREVFPSPSHARFLLCPFLYHEISQLVTGHSALNHYLYKIGQTSPSVQDHISTFSKDVKAFFSKIKKKLNQNRDPRTYRYLY